MVAVGAMPFTKAMYDDIDASIASIKKIATEQLFVTGRVDLLWKQVEAQTNVVQVHEASLQRLQSAAATATSYAPCQPCGLGVSGAMGVQTDDGSPMPKPPLDDGSSIAKTVLQIIGGNGQCHCVHVDALIQKVAALEAKTTHQLRADAPAYGAAYVGDVDPLSGADPWRRAGGAGGDGSGHGPGGAPPQGPGRDGMPRDASGKLLLPLTLREHIGSAGGISIQANQAVAWLGKVRSRGTSSHALPC